MLSHQKGGCAALHPHPQPSLPSGFRKLEPREAGHRFIRGSRYSLGTPDFRRPRFITPRPQWHSVNAVEASGGMRLWKSYVFQRSRRWPQAELPHVPTLVASRRGCDLPEVLRPGIKEVDNGDLLYATLKLRLAGPSFKRESPAQKVSPLKLLLKRGVRARLFTSEVDEDGGSTSDQDVQSLGIDFGSRYA